jgi:hypothetical protein
LKAFHPVSIALGVELPEKVNQGVIKRFKINFKLSSLLRERLSNVKFEKVTNGSYVEPEA